MMLTKGERRILQKMVDEEEDLVFSRGGGWWCGLHQTGGRLAWSLIRKMLIGESQYSEEGMEHWEINGSGRLALAGETKIYRTGAGKMVETIEEATRGEEEGDEAD